MATQSRALDHNKQMLQQSRERLVGTKKNFKLKIFVGSIRRRHHHLHAATKSQ